MQIIINFPDNLPRDFLVNVVLTNESHDMVNLLSTYELFYKKYALPLKQKTDWNVKKLKCASFLMLT